MLETSEMSKRPYTSLDRFKYILKCVISVSLDRVEWKESEVVLRHLVEGLIGGI